MLLSFSPVAGGCGDSGPCELCEVTCEPGDLRRFDCEKDPENGGPHGMRERLDSNNFGQVTRWRAYYGCALTDPSDVYSDLDCSEAYTVVCENTFNEHGTLVRTECRGEGEADCLSCSCQVQSEGGHRSCKN